MALVRVDLGLVVLTQFSALLLLVVAAEQELLAVLAAVAIICKHLVLGQQTKDTQVVLGMTHLFVVAVVALEKLEIPIGRVMVGMAFLHL